MKSNSLKNAVIKSAKYSKMSKIDVKVGKLTFGQRIELGKIMSEDIDEEQKFLKTFKCLYNYEAKPIFYKSLLSDFEEIIEGLKFWMIQESTLLKYEPTPEELKAGIKELSIRTGEMGTIKALAKAYSCDPDNVLKWEYGKVFGILFTDLEEYKYQVKYNKVVESKYKS